MSSVSHWIVREYFEMLGYMVSQPCKYHVGGRQKRMEEKIDLMVVSPVISEQRVPEAMLWTAADLKGVARAVIGIYGWHTGRFYPTTLENIPEILHFMNKESIRTAARWMGTSDIAKVLCLPQLPASTKLREQMLSKLKQKGVDGVLLFRTILLDLMSRTDLNRNYEKSDLLQIIRILKNYDLLSDPQMDLFPTRKRRSRKTVRKK